MLTLSAHDDKDGFPFPAANERTQARERAHEELFPKGRNFK